MNYLDFSGQVILVTRSTGNTGKSIASLFAEQGATLIVNSSSDNEIAETLHEFSEKGWRAGGIKADVKNWEEVKAMAEKIDNEFGRLDVVINNSGAVIRDNLDDLDDDAWMEAFRMNVLGAVHTTKAVLPLMKRQNKGCIINVAMTGLMVKRQNDGEFLSSRVNMRAVLGFSMAEAEVAMKFGVRINAIVSSCVQGETGQEYAKMIDEKNFFVLQRFCRPEEVASVCLFLASPLASFINREVISLDSIAQPDLHF